MSELASLGSAIVSLYFEKRGARQAQTGLSQLMSSLVGWLVCKLSDLSTLPPVLPRNRPAAKVVGPLCGEGCEKKAGGTMRQGGWFETCRVGQLTEMKRQTAAPIHCTSFCTIKKRAHIQLHGGIANWSLPLPCHPLRMSPCCSCRINLALT